MKKVKPHFAFLIHPPELKDVSKRYPIANYIPGFILEKILRILPPLIGTQITGFKLNGKEIPGIIVICPLTAQQMLKYPQLAEKKVTQSVLLAERLGCEYIGLGAFTSIATDGGLSLINKVNNIKLTSGNVYAAALIIENIQKAAKILNTDISKASLAIVGAAGSVGSACSRILSKKVNKIILIDKRFDELGKIAQVIKSNNNQIDLEYYPNIPSPIHADIVVSVASASKGIIESSHLRPGTIVIDAAQPHNVSAKVLETRNDVIIIHSGIAYLAGIDLQMNIGLNKEEIYACLGEVLMLMYRNWDNHYSLGPVNPELVEEVLVYAPKIGLRVADFRNGKKMVKDEDIIRVIKSCHSGEKNGLSSL
ncbi:MAG: hypothetical protein ABIH27_05310 [Candidatus Omnitrophota bacterium]